MDEQKTVGQMVSKGAGTYELVPNDAVVSEATGADASTAPVATPDSKPVLLKRAVTPRQRGPQSYDFLGEIQGIYFAFNEMSDAETKGVTELLEISVKERADLLKEMDSVKTPERANEIAARLLEVATEKNELIDDVLIRYLKGEGDAKDKIFSITPDEIKAYPRATKADLLNYCLFRNGVTESDSSFLSKPSPR